MLLSCTGPLAPQAIVRFHDLTGLVICQHYGTSETGALTNHVPSEVLSRPTSVGRPVEGVRLAVVTEAGEMRSAGYGLVFARGPAIGSGYVGSVHPRTVNGRRIGFVDGGFQTSDLGWLDSDGYLCLQPRDCATTTRYDMVEH